MIFYAEDPRATTAKIIDASGANICEHYFVKWYNTETQNACIMDTLNPNRGTITLKPDGLGGFAYNIIHFHGSKLVFE